MTTPIAFVTDTTTPALSADDQLLLAPLEEAGFRPQSVPWDQEGVEWSAFEAVIIRSAWNYHRHLPLYQQWLSTLETAGVSVWNPVPAVRWNVRKTYLHDLEGRGMAVIPTVWLDQGTEIDLPLLLQQHQWQEAVIKPVVGASASGIFKVSQQEAEAVQPRLQALLTQADWMIQPFLSQVGEEGEYSFVFLGGHYSHCGLKRPQAADFRVQRRYGGLTIPVEPPEQLLRQARAIYEALPQPLLYARIDGLNRRSQLLIMEVEINEPGLLLWCDQAAPLRFVRALTTLQGRAT